MARIEYNSEPVYPLRTAASRVGMSPRTLRLYEEAGLIAPVRVGGHHQRLYSEQDLQWLRCIRDMIHEKSLTVEAIHRLLDLVPCWEISHCGPEQAEACAPGLNIPGMADRAHGGPEAPESGVMPCETPCGLVELKLVYGVQEFGAILACSRCNHAERILRKVAAQYGGEVVVTKVEVSSDEAAQYGVLLPPAVLVDEELLVSGQGVSEPKLQRAIEEHLNRSR